MCTIKSCFKQLQRVLLMLVIAGHSALSHAQTLHVEIDTSGFVGRGWVDLMFNGAEENIAPAIVSLSSLRGFDFGVPAQILGNVSSSAAGGYTLDNLSNADLFHAVNFGATVSFNVDFGGAVAIGDYAQLSTFSVALYAADQITPLGNGDVLTGSLLHLYWTPSTDAATAGAVGVRVFDGIVSVSPVAAVPEPESWMMMGVGMGVLLLAGRRRTSPFTA